jgi:hypothetical protein
VDQVQEEGILMTEGSRKVALELLGKDMLGELEILEQVVQHQPTAVAAEEEREELVYQHKEPLKAAMEGLDCKFLELTMLAEVVE